MSIWECASISDSIDELVKIMAILRDPERGCAWDLQQSFDSIVPHTLEEAYEVADAVARRDFHDLRAELGDLLLQVLFHSRMAEEAGHFDFEDVASTLAEKLVRRHPHVFGDVVFGSMGEQHAAWETEKARERARKTGLSPRASHASMAREEPGTSPLDPGPSLNTMGDPSSPEPRHLDGVALALPALTRAVKLQKRASLVGFDWNDIGGIFKKVEEEVDELRAELGGAAPHDRLEDEMGDVLFTATNLARQLGIDPEAALRRSNAKFEQRFAWMEQAVRARGETMEAQSPASFDALWRAAKKGLDEAK